MNLLAKVTNNEDHWIYIIPDGVDDETSQLNLDHWDEYTLPPYLILPNAGAPTMVSESC